MFKVSISAFPEMLPLLPGLWLYEGIKIWWLLVASVQAKEDDRAALMLVGNITRSKKHANVSTIATPCDEAPSRTPWKFYTEHRGQEATHPGWGTKWAGWPPTPWALLHWIMILEVHPVCPPAQVSSPLLPSLLSWR